MSQNYNSNSRKSFTVERIRKRAATNGGKSIGGNAKSTSDSASRVDFYHNGETPASRLLVDAVYDMFPELHPSQSVVQKDVHSTSSSLSTDKFSSTTSSELGRILRWHILQRRKDRSFPPAPPLSSPTRASNTLDGIEDDPQDLPVAPSLTSKKKRKKKKKKKEPAALGSSDVDAKMTKECNGGSNVTAIADLSLQAKSIAIGSSSHANTDMDDTELIDKDDDVEHIPLKPEGGDQIGEEGGSEVNRRLRRMPKSKAEKTAFEASLESLDRSIHDMEEERMMLKHEATPDLLALPSDGSIDHDAITFSHEDDYFDQIEQEMTERGEDDDDNEDKHFKFHTSSFDNDHAYPQEMIIPLEASVSNADPIVNLEPPATPMRPGRPRLRSRTLSASSFESFEGGLTPTRNNSNEEFIQKSPSQHLASPTHEWVPEEGAEAKVETPPGDAIKNPLDMPYLLSLNSTGNRLTTTTIDGSLIFAEKPDQSITEIKLGSLAAAKILVEDWMGQLLQRSIRKHEQDSSSDTVVEEQLSKFANYINEKTQMGKDPQGIPFEKFYESVDLIGCQSCKHDVRLIIDEWANRESGKALVLNSVVLLENPLHGNMDTAFDYVALEEGHHVPKINSIKAEDEGADLSMNVSFLVDKPNSKKSGSNILVLNGISYMRITSFIETWFPCGVDEENLVNSCIGNTTFRDGSISNSEGQLLTPDEKMNIERHVVSRLESSRKLLATMEEEGNSLTEDFDDLELRLMGQQQNFNIVAFAQIKKIDDRCSVYRENLIRALYLLTCGEDNAMEESKLNIWTSFLRKLNDALQASDKYYEELSEMTDQRGKVPNPIMSAPFRKLFQSLVAQKVKAWTSFGRNICNTYRGRLLKEYTTHKTWHNEMAVGTSKNEDSLESRCMDLLRELEKWTETIGGPKMSDIYQVRMAQTEQMLAKLQNIVEPLSIEYATVEKYFSSERNMYFASLRSNIVLAQGVKKRMRLIDNAEVEGMVTGVLLMFTHVRLMQNRMINSLGVPPLPLQLKRWILQDEALSDADESSLKTEFRNHQQLSCQPGSASRRRAMCILAGLTYHWLVDQFKLWKAEEAERELLTGLEDIPEVRTSGNGNTKTNKSKKNKKKKVPKKLSSSSSVQMNEKLLGIDDTIAGLDASNETNISSQSTEATKDDQTHNIGLKDDSERAKEFCNSSDDVSEDEYFESRILIQDGEILLSAQEFLVERLRKTLVLQKESSKS